MIILDTHIWLWWVHDPSKLTRAQAETISAHETDLLGVSAISLWEIAKLVERQRITLPLPILEWFEQALSYPGVRVVEITPEVAVASTQLPGEFHRDPADQIIVATAKVNDCLLVTSDGKILDYPHVKKVG